MRIRFTNNAISDAIKLGLGTTELNFLTKNVVKMINVDEEQTSFIYLVQ